MELRATSILDVGLFGLQTVIGRLAPNPAVGVGVMIDGGDSASGVPAFAFLPT
jgi:hypothetical protein